MECAVHESKGDDWQNGDYAGVRRIVQTHLCMVMRTPSANMPGFGVFGSGCHDNHAESETETSRNHDGCSHVIPRCSILETVSSGTCTGRLLFRDSE